MEVPFFDTLGESFNDESIASPNYNEMTEAEREADFRRKHQ